MKKTITKNNRGSALLLVLALLSAALLMVLSLSNLVFSGLKMGQVQVLSTKSYFAAEAGIEEILYELRKNLTEPSEINITKDLDISRYYVKHYLDEDMDYFLSTASTTNVVRSIQINFTESFSPPPQQEEEEETQGIFEPPLSDPATLIYLTSIEYNGNLGGRIGANALCADAQPNELSHLCTDVKAFLSVGSGDQIVDMPDCDLNGNGKTGPYHCDAPIYWYDPDTGEKLLVDNNWVELGNGTIQNPHPAEGKKPFWTSTFFDLKGYATDNCQHWTVADSTQGRVGSGTKQVDHRWIDYSKYNCSHLKYLACVCKYN